MLQMVLDFRIVALFLSLVPWTQGKCPIERSVNFTNSSDVSTHTYDCPENMTLCVQESATSFYTGAQLIRHSSNTWQLKNGDGSESRRLRSALYMSCMNSAPTSCIEPIVHNGKRQNDDIQCVNGFKRTPDGIPTKIECVNRKWQRVVISPDSALFPESRRSKVLQVECHETPTMIKGIERLTVQSNGYYGCGEEEELVIENEPGNEVIRGRAKVRILGEEGLQVLTSGEEYVLLHNASALHRLPRFNLLTATARCEAVNETSICGTRMTFIGETGVNATDYRQCKYRIDWRRHPTIHPSNELTCEEDQWKVTNGETFIGSIVACLPEPEASVLPSEAGQGSSVVDVTRSNVLAYTCENGEPLLLHDARGYQTWTAALAERIGDLWWITAGSVTMPLDTWVTKITCDENWRDLACKPLITLNGVHDTRGYMCSRDGKLITGKEATSINSVKCINGVWNSQQNSIFKCPLPLGFKCDIAKVYGSSDKGSFDPWSMKWKCNSVDEDLTLVVFRIEDHDYYHRNIKTPDRYYRGGDISCMFDVVKNEYGWFYDNGKEKAFINDMMKLDCYTP